MKKTAVVDRSRCAACGACLPGCPRNAITVWRGCYSAVEESRCVGCGLCAKTCPADCISLKEREGIK